MKNSGSPGLEPEAGDVCPRIRVMLVISNLEYGGAQRQVVELANNLDPRRVEVHVCSLSPFVPLASALRIPADRVHVIVKRTKYDLTVVPKLARLIDRVGADVVHGYLFDAEIAVRLAGRARKVAVVAGSERNTDYHLKRVQRLVYRLTRSCVDLIIANSSHASSASPGSPLPSPIRVLAAVNAPGSRAQP